MKSFDFPNIFKYVVGYIDLNLNKLEQDSQFRQRRTQKLKTKSSSNQSVNVISCKNKLGIVSKGAVFNNICDSNILKMKPTVVLETDKKDSQIKSRTDKLSKTKMSGFSANTFRTIKDSIKQDIDKQNISNQDNINSTQDNKQSIFKIQKGKKNSKNKITIRKLSSKQQLKTNSKLEGQNKRINIKRTSIAKRMPERFMTQMIEGKVQIFDNKRNKKDKKMTKILKFNVKTTQNQSDIAASQSKKYIGRQKPIRIEKSSTKKTLKSVKHQTQQASEQEQQVQKNQINFYKNTRRLSKANNSLNTFKKNKKNIQNYTSLQLILDPQCALQKQFNLKQRYWKSQPLISSVNTDNTLSFRIRQKQKSSKKLINHIRKQSISNIKKVVFKQNSENQSKVFKGIKRIKKDKNSNDNNFSSQIHESQFYISSKKELKSSVKKIMNTQNYYGNVFLELNNFQKFMQLQTIESTEYDQNLKINQFSMFSQVKRKNQDQQIKDFKIMKFEQQKMLEMSKMFTKRANQLKQDDMRCLAYVSY